MKYTRILLKLSGEALMGDQRGGIDPAVVSMIATQVKEIREMGVEVALVIGGEAGRGARAPRRADCASCAAGEVSASVFDRYRVPLYRQASCKPYIIAAMIFLSKVTDPTEALRNLEKRGAARNRL